ADDVTAVLGLLAQVCGVDADPAALVARLAPHAAAPALLAMPRTDGEDLYAWADAIEIATLRAGA
ncbi:MAG TPA: hypothetical protein VM734_21630, partial [Kofleriaceae bacterium]|nr:hypothetical protein [Kofleriaceae bacterium]